jgi:hypothetical protein
VELIIELFVILCGILFWSLVILGWIVYTWKTKRSVILSFGGACLLLVPIIVVIAAFLNGIRIDTEQSDTWSAAAHGRTAQLERLIASGASINFEVDNFNQTPLMGAAWGGHGDTVVALLHHHADVNHKNRKGETALQLAKEQGHPDIVRLLKAAGAKE